MSSDDAEAFETVGNSGFLFGGAFELGGDCFGRVIDKSIMTSR